MKKLILSLMAAGFAVTSFAQGGWGNCFRQGSVLLYGEASYMNQKGSNTTSFANANSQTVDMPKYQNWTVSPGLGYSITDEITVGVDFNYRGGKTTYDRNSIGYGNNGYGTDQVKTWDYAIGPFVRCTMPIAGRFFWYGQLEAHYLKGRETYRSTNLSGSNSFVKDDNHKGFDAMYTPAVGILVCKSVAITFGVGGIGYEYLKYDYSTQGQPAGSEHTAKTNNFNVTLGQQVNLGVQKYFGCGHKMRHHGEPMDETRHIDTNDDNDEGEGRKRHRKDDDE